VSGQQDIQMKENDTMDECNIRLDDHQPLDLLRNLPRERSTIIAWARVFYTLDPDVNRIINQHALLITRCFEVKNSGDVLADKKGSEWLEKLGFPKLLEDMLVEYFVCGEVFPFADFDANTDCWSRIFIQNPDYIIVKRVAAPDEPILMLRPDEHLKRIVSSNRPADVERREQLDPKIIEAVRKGENIQLDTFNSSHLCRRISPYEIRGTSVLMPLFKTLRQELSPERTATIKRTLGDLAELRPVEKDVLMMRYEFVFQMFERWMNSKILEPMFRIHGFTTCPLVKFNRDRLRRMLGAAWNEDDDA
jgi:hypothetical protein